MSQSYANLYVEPSFPRCSNYTVVNRLDEKIPTKEGAGNVEDR